MINKQIISLKRLYEYARDNKYGIRKPQKGKQIDEYLQILHQLISDSGIPNKSGWYFWVRREPKVERKDIYIGKADNLVNRLIKEHLTKKEVFIWAGIYGINEAIELFDQCRGYHEENCVGVRKVGTTHILWVDIDSCSSGIDDVNNLEEILIVESKLIKKYRPIANRMIAAYYKKVSAIFPNVLRNLEELFTALEDQELYEIDDMKKKF